MKKVYILLFIGLIAISDSFGQLIQASLGIGTAANRVKIFVRPAASQNSAQLSTLQFNIGISTTVTPRPTMTVVSSSLTGNPTWLITQPIPTEGGFYNYQLTTAVSPISPVTAAGVEMEVLEVELTGGPLPLGNIALVTLPDGGLGASTGNSLYLCTGTLQSNGTNLYYTRPGVIVVNEFSYDASGASSGTTTSTATLTGISFPVRWLDFTAYKQNDNALVQWKVIGDETTIAYELERSITATDFKKIATVKKVDGSEIKTYNYTDVDITRLQSSVIYYRVKQIDTDGSFSYSEVRALKLYTKGDIAIFPNPVKDGFYLQIGKENAIIGKLNLELQNSLGQVLESRIISATEATNYYFKLSNTAIGTGTYHLKIYSDNILIETKPIIIKR